MNANILDIIIFGATGFTGKYAVREAAKMSKDNSFSWGVAGRNKERLNDIIKEFAPGCENISIVIADINDEDSLKKMAKMAKVIVNCCGPYRLFGEPVIKACIDSGTHHVDISGEPQYMENMQFKYNTAAQNAGVYIISACGFDSIPCDLGIIFAQQNFKGEVNSVEAYISSSSDYNRNSASVHYGTWKSAVYGLAYANELHELRSKLYPTALPKFEPKLRSRGLIHRFPHGEQWALPFMGSDRSVAYRSQRFLYEHYKTRPAQVQVYFTLKSLWAVSYVACLGVIFSLMTKCKFGQRILLKYPKFFSGGFASHEGPDPEAMEKSYFSIVFHTSGWKEKLTEPIDKHVGPIDKYMITKVSGKNPGYGATCIMALVSALTILREADQIPNNGGVFSPGAAFAKTSMIETLNNNNIKFEVISTTEK